MTDYYTGFSTENEVASFSQNDAWLRGCQNDQGDITAYWQAWIEHPVQVQFALEILNSDFEPVQDTTGYTRKTQAEMEADDWFIGV